MPWCQKDLLNMTKYLDPCKQSMKFEYFSLLWSKKVNLDLSNAGGGEKTRLICSSIKTHGSVLFVKVQLKQTQCVCYRNQDVLFLHICSYLYTYFLNPILFLKVEPLWFCLAITEICIFKVFFVFSSSILLQQLKIVTTHTSQWILLFDCHFLYRLVEEMQRYDQLKWKVKFLLRL